MIFVYVDFRKLHQPYQVFNSTHFDIIKNMQGCNITLLFTNIRELPQGSKYFVSVILVLEFKKKTASEILGKGF